MKRERAILFAAIYLPILFMLGGLAAILYSQQRAKEAWVHEQESIRAVDLSGEILERDFDAVQSDLLYLAGQKPLMDFLASRPGTSTALAREYQLFCGNKRGVYDQVRFLDDSGREVVRVDYAAGTPRVIPPDRLQDKSARYYFQPAKSLKKGGVYVSPFDLNVEKGSVEVPWKPMIRFAAPVFDESGRKRGVVVLNFMGERLFKKIEEVAAGASGPVMLVNRKGYWLRGPRAESDWGFMSGLAPTFKGAYPDAWNRIRAAGEGRFETPEGMFTFRSADRAALSIVSHIPPGILRRGSRLFLAQLSLILSVIAAFLMVLVDLLSISWIARRREARKLVESEARLRILSTKLLTVQEAERERYSRDLHDDLGQVVTAINIDLAMAESAAQEDKRRKYLLSARENNMRVLERIHQLASDLRPRVLDDLGLQDAVRSFLMEFRTRTGIDADADLQFARGVPAEASSIIYRILQESMTNVLKHAKTKSVSVRLTVSSDNVSLTVRDEGVGFDPKRIGWDSLGILGMRERVELSAGEFRLISRPGEGTEVRASLPLRAKDPED